MDYPQRGTLLEIEEGARFMPLFDAAGLIPCVTQDWQTNEVLMLGWMNREALEKTLATGMAHYWSRARQQLWKKGEQSGQAQIVKHVLVDDDQDCLLLKVALTGGAACHVGYRSCFFRELDPAAPDSPLAFLESEKVYDPRAAYGIHQA